MKRHSLTEQKWKPTKGQDKKKGQEYRMIYLQKNASRLAKTNKRDETGREGKVR